MDKYKVTIYKILAKAVNIEAEYYSDAIKKIREKYYNGEIVLSDDDYYNTEFDC